MTTATPAPAALDPALWPDSARRDASGAIEIGGVGVERVRAEVGTPAFVLDERHLEERAARVVRAFEAAAARIGTTAAVYYAGKAFLCGAVAQAVTAAGMRIDVASGGELHLALAAGVDAARLGLHGNNKSDRELARAAAAGVGAVVVDALEEIPRVAAAAEAAGVVQAVRLRVNSGVHAETHAFLATAHEDQKFGIALGDADGAAAAVRAEPSLRLLGLHGHIGSQIFGADGFAEAAGRLLEVHARLLAGGDVPELNLGGGFGVAYVPGDDPADIEALADGIADAVAAACERLRIPVPALAFEPGRSVVAQSTVTLYEAGTVKDVRVDADGVDVRRYISVDGGMSDNARPALYGARYTVELASRASDAEPTRVRIAGKHCESGDILIEDDLLPADTGRGDLLAVPVTGAYCWSLASNYNYLGRPPVVGVRDGRIRVLVRGETEDDLLARDMGLETPR